MRKAFRVPMIDGSAGDRNEAQLKADLERVWLQIDERGKGIIDSSKLGELTNALGQSMTTKEVQEMTRALCHGADKGKVTFSSFFSYWCCE